MFYTQSTPGSGRGRGGFAARRGRGGWSSAYTKRKEVIKPDIERYPLGDLLETFRISDLKIKDAESTNIPGISDCLYVTSYNWLNEKAPTIIVPGKPPQWTPPRTQLRLKEDSGQYYRDPNAAKFPDHPISPAIQAILDINPQVSMGEINVFACGSTIGNLLRFVRGFDKAFRFNIERIGETVFFIRRENDPKEIIQGVRGFGHTFPEAYTTWEKETKGSETHQRIIRYKLGGLECMIRFECDGYLNDNSSSDKSKHNESNRTSDANDLLSAMQNTFITQSTVFTTSKGSAINLPILKHAGSYVPQSAIFDLKTRSGKYNREIDMSDIYPQLWVKQIPNFIVAYHDGAGLFQDIRIQNVRKDVQTWEKDNKDAICRLALLLRKIIDITKGDKVGLLEAYCDGTDCLEIRRQYGEGVHALPDVLRRAWVRENESRDGAHDVDLEDKQDNTFDHSDDSDEEDKDFTACSAEGCGYCGKCTY